MWFSVLPLGLGAGVPYQAGVRARNMRWRFVGLAWLAVNAAAWITSVAARGNAGGESVAGLLIIVGWIGPVVSTLAIRRRYIEKLGADRGIC
ncbi:MAG: hypothetical protein M3065_00020 [Actinomycetota bacterium]|nr:hypothetical protein [Actinomycetota bacterium]